VSDQWSLLVKNLQMKIPFKIRDSSVQPSVAVAAKVVAVLVSSTEPDNQAIASTITEYA